MKLKINYHKLFYIFYLIKNKIDNYKIYKERRYKLNNLLRIRKNKLKVINLIKENISNTSADKIIYIDKESSNERYYRLMYKYNSIVAALKYGSRNLYTKIYVTDKNDTSKYIESFSHSPYFIDEESFKQYMSKFKDVYKLVGNKFKINYDKSYEFTYILTLTYDKWQALVKKQSIKDFIAEYSLYENHINWFELNILHNNVIYKNIPAFANYIIYGENISKPSINKEICKNKTLTYNV